MVSKANRIGFNNYKPSAIQDCKSSEKFVSLNEVLSSRGPRSNNPSRFTELRKSYRLERNEVDKISLDSLKRKSCFATSASLASPDASQNEH